MKTIKIDSIEQKEVQYGTLTILTSNGDKYSFFDTKKDGSNTKAYEQFKKYEFKIGDTVSAEVKEEQDTFTNKEGKKIDYTRRTILYFQEVENTPVVKSGGLEIRVDDLEKRVKDLENLDSVPEIPPVNQDNNGVKPENVFGE